MLRNLVVAGMILPLVLPIAAHGFVTHVTPNLDDPALTACLEALKTINQIEQQVAFATFSGPQSTGTSAVEIFWKRFTQQDSRVLVEVDAPPARRGVKLLVLEADQSPPGLHMYLPELRSVRRITGKTLHGALLGTDFNYEDFLHLYGLSADATLQKQADERVAERDVFVSDVLPGDEDSGYSKIRSFIDQQWCVPLRVEFYAKDTSLRKVLDVSPDEVVLVNEHHVPMAFQMHDLEQDTRTKARIESIEINEPIKDSMFSLSHLRSGH